MIQNVTLKSETVLARLSEINWYTVNQITDDLRQCGPLAYRGECSDDQYRLFRQMSKRQQYQTVYNLLLRMRKLGIIESALGDGQGKEVRVFKIVSKTIY